MLNTLILAMLFLMIVSCNTPAKTKSSSLLTIGEACAVNAEVGLRLRDAPFGNLITTLENGTKISIIGEDELNNGLIWVKIKVENSSDDTQGFVARKYLICGNKDDEIEDDNKDDDKDEIPFTKNSQLNFSHYFIPSKDEQGKYVPSSAKKVTNWIPFDGGSLDLGVMPMDKSNVYVKLTIDGRETTGELKLRGGLTLGNPAYGKKSFTMTFDKPRPSIDGSSKKRLIFLSNNNDSSFIRNEFAMAIAKMLGAKAPDIYFHLGFNARRRPSEHISNPQIGPVYYTIMRHTKSIAKLDNAEPDEKNTLRIFTPERDIWDTWEDAEVDHFMSDGEPEGVKSESGTPEEAVTVLKNHCNGQDVFDRDDYFLYLALNFMFADVDSMSKNFYIYLRNDGKYGFFHWDHDAIFGYAPDGNKADWMIHWGKTHLRPGIDNDITCLKGRKNAYDAYWNTLKTRPNLRADIMALFENVKSNIDITAANADLAGGFWARQDKEWGSSVEKAFARLEKMINLRLDAIGILP